MTMSRNARRRLFIEALLAGLLALPVASAYGQAEKPEVATASNPAAAPNPAADPAPASDYLRLGRDDAGVPVALQTSIVRFRPADGALPADLEVDLVGAVHVGDSRYYQELNARFTEYDAVLYELVAPEGTRVPLGGVDDASFLSGIQGGMADVLGLTFQLDQIDYTRPNLIHSDLSPEDLSRSMAERGETPAGLIARALAMSMNEYAKDPMGVRSLALVAAFFSADRERMLKAQLAPMLLDMENSTAVFEGESGTSVIGERNKRAVSVLEERIRLGDRRIAIFFGAAHMTGIAELVETGLGLNKDSTVWVDAWNLR
jgi:hypothetical protein